MPDHLIYGGRLRSSVAFPDPLPGSAERPDWTLRVARRLGAMRSAHALGREAVADGVQVSLLRHERGFRLCYDDTGDFDVSRDGRRIRWWPGERVEPRAVEADVVGRVLPLALHLRGVLALHGSAVAVDGSALVFVAPKFSGKSTLAWALTTEGAALLTDDVAALTAGDRVHLLPGAPDVRLWPDVAGRLAGRVPAGEEKVEIEAREGHHLREPVPVGAIYVLTPAAANAEAAARRTPLTGPAAVLALVAHTRLGALLRGAEARRLLTTVSAVARVVPVHVLEIARDLERVSEAAQRILAWHRAST